MSGRGLGSVASGSVRRRQCTHRYPNDHPRAGEKVENCRRAHGWWYVIDAGRNPSTGKRKQVTKSGFRTKEAADKAMREELSRIDGGIWADDKRVTVGEFLTDWLDYKRATVAPKTFDSYKSHVNDVFIPTIGHIRLRDLRQHHVESMLAELAKPRTDRPAGNSGAFVKERSAVTLDWYRRTLRAALGSSKGGAVKRKLIAVNPAEGDLDSLPDGDGAEHENWTTEQTVSFLTGTASTDAWPIWVTAAFCGVRRAELLGMRWCDLEANADGEWTGLNVTTTLAALAGTHRCDVCGREHVGRYLKRPKSAAGKRWVPIAPAVSEALGTQRSRQDDDREAMGRDYVDHDLVFALPDGEPMRPAEVTRAFVAEIQRLGLPRIRLHDLRGGATSMLLAGGVPIELVSMVLGHADPATTRKHYAKLMRAETRELVANATRGLIGEQSVSNSTPEALDSSEVKR